MEVDLHHSFTRRTSKRVAFASNGRIGKRIVSREGVPL